MSGYEDCARQRNLTDRGRDEARRIGVAIKRLDIPIGDVLASPFCRTRETAQLIFGRATVAPAVRGGPARADSDDRYAELRKLLSTPPSRGTNLAIASHGNPFRAVTDTQYLAEGEAAVIRPLGAQGFRIVARIPKDGWDALTAP
jgi:phosphohistidine phosphatase SixA